MSGPFATTQNFIDSIRDDLGAAVGIIHCATVTARQNDQLEIGLALDAARYRLEMATSDFTAFMDKVKAADE